MVSQPGKTGGGTGHGGGGEAGFGGGGGGALGGNSGGRPGNGRTGGGIWEQFGLHIHQVVSDCWKHTEYPYQGSQVLVSSAQAVAGDNNGAAAKVTTASPAIVNFTRSL